MIPDSYFERFDTAKYRHPGRVQRALIRRFVARFHAQFVAANPVASVLEVGAGEGFLSGWLSERFPEKRFVCVDIDGQKLALLRRSFGRIETFERSAYALAFDPGTFDLVVCPEVLEHLERPGDALAEVARLRPRRAIFTVPHEPFFRLSNLLRGKNVARLGNDPEHLQLWSARAFRRLLAPEFELLDHGLAYPWQLALCAPRAGAPAGS
ncbi:MAG: methyltransferase domain-containing protein [Myxococcales bacterium]|nr:methyltransferase domain-containing protein [Myxococcales bacterium]